MAQHLFGPVPSRRLGISLGVDLIPKKVCSLDCIYCEVGKTTGLTTERREYVAFDDVAGELLQYFANHDDPDYITFSGSGEPTLNSRIGDVIAFTRRHKPGIPVAVLTNGTLLHDPEVRKELVSADVVLPSLDAATEATFQKINRPCRSLDIEKVVQGLIDFRMEFRGKIWLEVFILPGYNDDKAGLEALRSAIGRIRPDRIQLNTLDRPGTVAGIRAATSEELAAVVDTLGMEQIEIIAEPKARRKIGSYKKDSERAILETLSRRPCTVDDLTAVFGMHGHEINKYLDVLESEGKIESVFLKRGIFYQLKGK
ncbi:MAG: radical SAM protein [Desulfobacterales bacterium]